MNPSNKGIRIHLLKDFEIYRGKTCLGEVRNSKDENEATEEAQQIFQKVRALIHVEEKRSN